MGDRAAGAAGGLLLAEAARGGGNRQFTNSWWQNNSSNPECFCDSTCCEKPAELIQEASNGGTRVLVSARTGELVVRHFLFDVPGKLEPWVGSMEFRSMRSGMSQVGNRWVMGHDISVQTSGSTKYVRLPNGLILTYVQSGGVWSSTDCLNTMSLAQNGSGQDVLEDKYGNTWTFNSYGQLDSYTDATGNNTLDYTFNASYRWTGLTDTRGKSFTISANSDGFIGTLTDPASRAWGLGYDGDGNLTFVTSPTTPDQSSGITTTFGYDGSQPPDVD